MIAHSTHKMILHRTLKRFAFLAFIFAAIFCTFSFAHAQAAAGQNCTDGGTSAPGTTCQPCPGGGNVPLAALCPKVCDDGTFPPAGSLCVTCSNGKTSANTGSCPSGTTANAPANNSLGVGGNCEYNPSACQSGLVCQNNPDGDDTCVSADATTVISCGVGTVSGTNTCTQCPNGGTADTLADCNSAANSNNSNSNTTLQNPLNATSLVQLLQEVLNYVTYIGGIFLVLVLVFVGFQFVMARGNPEAIGKAQRALLWTVIGGLILLGASAIATVIVSTAASL
jgi:hypothetical protein